MRRKAIAIVCVVLLCINSIPWPSLIMGTRVPFVLGSTSAAPASYSNFGQFVSHISKWSILKTAGVDAYENSVEQGTYVIPGLERTLSLNSDQRPESCTEMVPQGLCVTDEYVLISAYCHDHQHNSVIYVLNRKSHKYIKTVVLEGKPHAGSIAWDAKYRHVWISTGSTNKATASYLRIRDIDKYDFQTSGQALPYAYTAKLTELTRNSFMTCYENSLYAGTFTLNEPTMRLQQFDFATAGHMVNGKVSAAISDSMIIGQQCQGIAMNDHYIFLTYSYGPYIPSTLCIYRKSQTRFLKSDAIRTYTLPPCLEQPWVEGNTLYLMWESGARCFRNEQITHIDRVISMDIKKLMS